ncbi:MAG: serine hydrolase, partial [Deltaproteobacteria bacterium]|nr:serine hydrolase [Deltaproteobacteria bacterium]
MLRRTLVEKMPKPVRILSGKYKTMSIVLSFLLLLSLYPVQTGTADQPETRLQTTQNSKLLARKDANPADSGDTLDRDDPPDTRTMENPQQRSRWRGKWLTASPSSQGLDPVLLKKTVSRIGQMKGVYSLIVVRDGYILVEKYFREGRQNKPHNLKSASKSVLSVLIGIAIEDGYISLDQPITELLPKIKSFDDPRKGRITVRHLLTMTSGLDPTSYDAYNIWISNRDWVMAALDRPMVSEPGSRFQYSTGNSHILSGILTENTGMSTQTFAERKLFDPLNVKVQGWATDPNGIYQGGNNLSLIPRDMAKLGQLYLDGGRFGNRQVVPKWWVEASTRPSDLELHEVYGTYGYSWYVRPGRENAFVAVGYGGQYIYVSPSYDTVIVVTSTLESKGRVWEKHLFEHLQSGILGSIEQRAPLLRHADAVENTSGAQSVAENRVSTNENPGPTTVTRSDATPIQSKGRATTNIILRSKPNLQSSRIGLVNTGDVMDILETDGNWHRVRLGNRKGWVYGDYIRLQPTARHEDAGTGEKPEGLIDIIVQSPAEGGLSETVLLTADKLNAKSARTKTRVNFRSGPGKSYTVIRTINPGINLTVKDQTGEWLRVQAGKGEGWVHRDFVQLQPTSDVSIAALKPGHSGSDRKIESDSEEQPITKGAGTTPVSTGVRNLEAQVDQLRDRLNSTEAGQKRFSADLDSMRQNRHSQQAADEESALARKALELKLAGARQEIDRLYRNLAESQADRKKLSAEVTALRQALDAQQAAGTESAAERAALRTDLALASQEIAK